MSATAAEPGASPIVELRVSAEPSQLSIVRAVSAAIAGQADFDLDAIADVRLAMDEACSILIVRAIPGTALSCRFRTGGNGLTVAISAPVIDSDSAGQRSFGWHVLSTLTDSIEMTHGVEAESTVATIAFTKNRMVDA